MLNIRASLPPLIHHCYTLPTGVTVNVSCRSSAPHEVCKLPPQVGSQMTFPWGTEEGGGDS